MTLKRIALIGDLHCGDYTGLWHPDYIVEGGQWTNNPGQRYLYECWQDLLKWYPKKLDAVIVNGDAVAGENLAERGAKLVTTDIKEQAYCASMLLDPLRNRTDKFWVIRGTPYHENRKAEGPETLGDDLEATKWPDGKWSGMWLVAQLDDVILDVSHEIPFGFIYMSTALEREGTWSRKDKAGKNTNGKRIVVIRSHRHEYRIVGGLTRNLDDIEISVPCFQLQTELAQRKSPNKLVPDIGGILLEIDRGENGIRVLRRCYKHPVKEIIKI
jgi:hypothetical protein